MPVMNDSSTPTPAGISDYHARLPYGQRVSAEPVLGGPFFPFDGDLRVVPLDNPVIPEPPRNGEPGGDPCFRCANPDAHVIWRDERWNVRAGFASMSLPMVAALAPNEHVTMHTMPMEVAASLGPVIQRVAVAIGRIPGVGRTHFSRWGDGSEHFHMWFLARPLGMMQMRGAMLAIWDDLLPPLPDKELATNLATVGSALAEGGGEAAGAGAG
jgi:hypothetical protein